MKYQGRKKDVLYLHPDTHSKIEKISEATECTYQENLYWLIEDNVDRKLKYLGIPSDDEQAIYQADQQELKKQYWNDVYQAMSDEENKIYHTKPKKASVVKGDPFSHAISTHKSNTQKES